MIKVPFGLYAKDIGGLNAAQEARKVNFHVQGRKFLRDILDELGSLAGEGVVTSNPAPYKESGTISFQSKLLLLELKEQPNSDPEKRSGVRLYFRAFSEDNKQKFAGYVPVVNFKKNGRLDLFIRELKDTLVEQLTFFH